MKNELIIARHKDDSAKKSHEKNDAKNNSQQRLEYLLQELNLEALRERFIY